MHDAARNAGDVFPSSGGREVRDADRHHVRFRGGVLNEFYPAAEASIALDTGRIRDKMAAGVIGPLDREVLNNFVVGKLKWEGVRIHDTVVAPLTSSPIWLAPREVQRGASSSPSAGEGERFLFLPGRRASRRAAADKTQPRTTFAARARAVRLARCAVDRNSGRLAGRRALRRKSRVSRARRLSLLRTSRERSLPKIKRFGSGDYKADGAKLLARSLKRVLIINQAVRR